MSLTAKILLATAIFLAPQLAHTCVIQLPQCDVGSGYAELWGENQGAVFFVETYPGNDNIYSKIVLAECRGRTGLSVDTSKLSDEKGWKAEELFHQYLITEEKLTPRQIRQRMRAEGIRAKLITLPADHCGCDLPNIPAPENYCPPDAG